MLSYNQYKLIQESLMPLGVKGPNKLAGLFGRLSEEEESEDTEKDTDSDSDSDDDSDSDSDSDSESSSKSSSSKSKSKPSSSKGGSPFGGGDDGESDSDDSEGGDSEDGEDAEGGSPFGGGSEEGEEGDDGFGGDDADAVGGDDLEGGEEESPFGGASAGGPPAPAGGAGPSGGGDAHAHAVGSAMISAAHGGHPSPHELAAAVATLIKAINPQLLGMGDELGGEVGAAMQDMGGSDMGAGGDMGGDLGGDDMGGDDLGAMLGSGTEDEDNMASFMSSGQPQMPQRPMMQQPNMMQKHMCGQAACESTEDDFLASLRRQHKNLSNKKYSDGVKAAMQVEDQLVLNSDPNAPYAAPQPGQPGFSPQQRMGAVSSQGFSMADINAQVPTLEHKSNKPMPKKSSGLPTIREYIEWRKGQDKKKNKKS